MVDSYNELLGAVSEGDGAELALSSYAKERPHPDEEVRGVIDGFLGKNLATETAQQDVIGDPYAELNSAITIPEEGVFAKSRDFRITTTPNTRVEAPTYVVSKQDGILDRSISRFLGSDVEVDPYEMERIGAVMLGGIAGAKAGASGGAALGPAGAVVGGAVGGVAGAAAGAAVPEQTLEFMEAMGIVPNGTREERGLSDAELRRVMVGEALLESEFLGLAAATRLAGRAVGRAASGIDKEAELAAEAASKLGVDLPTYAAGKSNVGKGIVAVLGRFPLFGSKARRAGAAAEQSLAALKEELPERIAPLVSESALGIDIFKESKDLFTTVHKAFGDRYDDLMLEAKRSGVFVTPDDASAAAQSILKNIDKISPTQLVDGEFKQTPAAAGGYVKEFIEREMGGLTEQSLAQMDELLAKIDQTIAAAPQEYRRQVAHYLTPLKGAAKADIVNHMSGSDPQAVGAIRNRLAEIDADFTETMANLFETATAKKMGRVRRRGLKGITMASEANTTVNIDTLAKIVVDLQSPQAIDELSRLVGKETFDKIGTRVLSDAMERGIRTMSDGSTKLDAAAFGKYLGLGERPTARGEAMGRLFQNAAISKDNLKTMQEVIGKLSAAPVPDISTFVARRGVMGGMKSIMRSFAPVIAVGGVGMIGGVFHSLLLLGGSRALVGAVSDPTNARALTNVMDDSLTRVAQRTAALQLLKSGVQASLGPEDGETPEEAAGTMQDVLETSMNKLFVFGQEMLEAVYPDKDGEKDGR